VTLEEGMRLFLEASFRPDMVRHGPPSIDETRVRRTMRDSAAYTLALLREVSKIEGPVGEIRTSVAWLSPPDYGEKRLAVVVSSNAGMKFLRWVPASPAQHVRQPGPPEPRHRSGVPPERRPGRIAQGLSAPR
jgi:hypothetical protein